MIPHFPDEKLRHRGNCPNHSAGKTRNRAPNPETLTAYLGHLLSVTTKKQKGIEDQRTAKTHLNKTPIYTKNLKGG